MAKITGVRSFIAIDLPQKTKEEIFRFQESLKLKNPVFTWEDPDKLHITLHFLGKVSDSVIDKLSLSLTQVLETQKSFDITPYRLNYFYKKHDDSSIFLEIHDDAQIRQLEKLIRKLLVDSGFSPSHRFYPHINIARLKRLRHPNQVKEALFQALEIPVPKFSTFIVDHITIFESTFDKSNNTSKFKRRATSKFGSSFSAS